MTDKREQKRDTMTNETELLKQIATIRKMPETGARMLQIKMRRGEDKK